MGLSAVAAEPNAPAASPSPATQFIPASDSRIRYFGRFDFGDPGRPVVIWEASTIGIDFDGDRVAVRFSGVTGQVFFDATVDGDGSILALREGMPDKDMALAVSGPGPHHLVLFKRSEATAGTACFTGFEIAPGARVFPQAPAGRAMRMMFIGDSITVGACDEDGDKDQWEDRRTHNAAFSWAALTAAAFSADYQNISVSGIGVAAGYVDVLDGQVWDRIYPKASSPRARLGEWTPDVVFVLLGGNDDSYPRDHGLPFPDNFVENYVSLVHQVRAAYPKSPIVLIRGAMWEGTHSPPLIAGLTTAVSELESKDPGISHFVFTHWTSNHPRVADHRALADEVIPWLKGRPFMNSGATVPR